MPMYKMSNRKNFTNNGLLSFSHVISGGGTASDLHSRVTCLSLSEVILWMPLMPAMLGGTREKRHAQSEIIHLKKCQLSTIL